ncbi:MAG: hypothetical protein K1Y01_10380 [Vicinamibacteria bacterium]|nr:hypothetical protein [Vicinamibacteria bacterium]
MKGLSPAKQWDIFLSRFDPKIKALVRGALLRLRKRLPGAVELVYDNYNALVIGFGATDRASDALFSLAIYPKWVNLFFLQGAGLDDSEGLLQGSGNVVRHIRLSAPLLLDDPRVRDLMDRAKAQAAKAIDPRAKRRMIIKAVSPKQRPRKP